MSFNSENMHESPCRKPNGANKPLNETSSLTA